MVLLQAPRGAASRSKSGTPGVEGGVETMERRFCMSVFNLSVDVGDYQGPDNNSSSGPQPGSMFERIHGFNGTFTFNTDHNGVDGGAAQALVTWGDETGNQTVQPYTVYAGAVNNLSHTYAEKGDYTLSIDVYDQGFSGYATTTSGGVSYVSWQGNDASSTNDLSVADAPLGDLGGGFTFEPNQSYSGTVGYIGDPLDTASDGSID